MKKRLTIIVTALILSFTCFFAAACSGGKYGPEFEFENPEKQIVCDLDEGMTLDGKNDESVYDGNVYYETVSTDGSSSSSIFYGPGSIEPATVRFTTHFGEKGIYVYAEVGEQHIVRWDGTKKTEHNRNWNKTGISLYLCRMGETSRVNRAWELTLAADGESTMRKYAESGWLQTPNGGGYAVDIINGNLNENGNGTCDGYNMEVFMPWSSLDLEAKPETFMVALALIRHPNATGRTERLFEYVAASGGNPSNWIPFTENGMFVPPTPVCYGIDGDLSDWADYEGKNNDINLFSVMSDDDGNYIDANGNPSAVAIAADVDADERYIHNKMVYGSDGLYISTEALMRIYMTDHTQWWRNSSVEMRVRDKNYKTRTLQFGANGFATSGTVSVWKCEDTTVKLGDETLKRITHEAFLPKAMLDIWGLEYDDESIEVNYAFRNGRYQPGDGDDPSTYTLDLNETKQAQFVGAGTPYIFVGLGSSPYSGGGYLKVTENGITPAVHADEKYTLDGNATEWADYEGVHAVSMGRMGVDGDTTDVNKGFDLIARKGSDGLYFYATVKHADWRENDVQAWMSSNLALGFALTTVNHTNATAEFLDGNEIFFTANGPSSTRVAAWMSDTKNAQRDADGLYTTVIEGFVPYDAMLSLNTTSDSKTNKVGQWSKIFNPETGEVKDGYALRLGVQWRTRNEIIGTQGRNDRADIQALDYWGVPVFVDGNVKTYDIDRKDCGWRMYYVSDSGIHTSKAEAKHAVIDGKADDWADYPTDAVEYKLTGDDVATSVSFKAMLREDGLYVLTTARMKGYLTGNAFEYNLNGEKVSHLNYASSQWYRNTNFEVFAKKSDGTAVKLAYVTPFTSNNDLGDLIIKAGADVSWAVQKNGSYYDSVAELFINAEYLKRALGVNTLPAYADLRFIYTTANLKGIPTELAPENTDLYNGGLVWNNGQYVKTGYYGMFDELVEGSTSIEDAELEFIDGYDEQTESVVCNGMPWEIVSGITLGGNKLLFGRDYVVTYQSNVDCGEALYVVKGINAYCGEISGSFEIKSIDISDTVSVELNCDALVQSTGGAKPTVTVTNGDSVLVEGEDYELSYSGNIYLDEKVGDSYKAKVTVTYVGMYGDTQPSTHEYTYKAFDGAHKAFDGAASAYTQAAGQEIALTADDTATDGRGLWYKAQLTEEGLYIVAKVRHNTLITLDNATDRNPWNSSHFEIRIGAEDSVRGFINFADGSGASRDVYYEKTTFASAANQRTNTEGFFDLVVMRSTECSGTYARETVMEAFMSKNTMAAYGIGADEWTRVSLSWKTNGENLNFKNGGSTSRWQYNGITPDHLGAYVDETGIMSRMVNNGDGSFDNLAVLEKGYLGKSASELTFDGKDNDWTDYNGYDIKVYARGTDEGKSLVFKAKLGDEGMYFFAENKHDILITDETAADNEASQLAFEFMLANKSEGTAYNGGMTFLSALGGTHVDGSVYIFKTVNNGAATPKYTTTIEGFIPWQSIIGGYINVDNKVSDDVINAISPKTGLKDGWTLHLAVGFRTKGETYKLSKASAIGTLEEKSWIYQGYRASARPALTATDFNAKPYQMFGVTKNGIDDITDSYAIDGVADTTAGITSRAFTLTAANDTVFTTRTIKHYARFTDEGLYYAMNVSTNHYDFATDAWWKNMSFKMRALKAAEASSSDNIELFTISGDGGCFGTDYGVSTYEWNIVENASYDGTVENGYKYNITLELFITRAAVEKKTGTLQSKLKICPEFVATNSNSGSYVLIEGKSGGQRWFVPALWEGANYNTASWFYVGANGIE